MKELSIEEKAKAYDEALERAEKALEVLGTDKCEGARQILSLFPELCESENEKIRRALMKFIEKIPYERLENDGVSVKDALAWLEKQDPKKHEEELEKAYKTADKVQYRRGYEAAVKETEKQGGQKSDWSNKEKLMLNDIIEATERSNIFMEDYQRELVDWLKSLKQRIGGKQ